MSLHLSHLRLQKQSNIKEHPEEISKSLDVQEAHHVISRQELLQELRLFVHDSFDDELVILGNVENRTTGSWVRQLDQWLVTQRILQTANKQNHNHWHEIHTDKNM